MTISLVREMSNSNAAPISASRKPVLLIMEFDPIITIDLVQTFEKLGLEVHTSRTFAEAEGLLGAKPHINVLLTDVDVPWGASSNKLARVLRTRKTPLRVSILSGPETALNVLPPDTRIHSKPFHLAGLIEDVLGL